jgi:hypothetical protein
MNSNVGPQASGNPVFWLEIAPCEPIAQFYEDDRRDAPWQLRRGASRLLCQVWHADDHIPLVAQSKAPPQRTLYPQPPDKTSVTGRKSGKRTLIPVWFVPEDEMLYPHPHTRLRAPVQERTQEPTIRLMRETLSGTPARPAADAKAVKSVAEACGSITGRRR